MPGHETFFGGSLGNNVNVSSLSDKWLDCCAPLLVILPTESFRLKPLWTRFLAYFSGIWPLH
jgi:hypothetical protein